MAKTQENYLFCFTKFLLVIVFFILFLLLMSDVWEKYRTKLTNTGIGYKSSDESTKVLPCITIRPAAAYKKHGFFYTKQDYEENTFNLDDVFHPETVERLSNESLYTIDHLNTLVYGKCHKLCYKNPVSPQKGEQLVLKKQSDYIIYTLGEEEEFWLVMPSRFPYEIGLQYLDSHNDNGIISVNYIIQAIQTSVINRRPTRATLIRRMKILSPTTSGSSSAAGGPSGHGSNPTSAAPFRAWNTFKTLL